MLNKYKEQKNQRWINRNSIKNNEEYVEKVVDNIKFDKHHIVVDRYGDYSLIITQKIEDYKIEVDEEDVCYKIFKRNKASNPKYKERYRLIRDFKCDDIYEVLKYIKDQSNISIKKLII